MKKLRNAAALAAIMALLSACSDITDISDAASFSTTANKSLTEDNAVIEMTLDGFADDEPDDKPDETPDEPSPETPDSTLENAIETAPAVSDEPMGTVTVAFAGDVTQSDIFGDVTGNFWPNYALGDVEDIFSAADIAFVNLETCVSERGESEKREGYGFRTAPERLEVFSSAGIDIVSLANNHVRDFGMDALSDTFESLDRYGLAYVGAGKDLKTAEKLHIYDINGLKVGFTACNAYVTNESWFASDETAGINCVMIGEESAETYLRRVKEYDKQCDVLFVSIHWGVEYYHGVTDEQRGYAHKLCDSGADVILGHHPHVLEPVENYGGKMIFYSLGNFLFYKMDDDAGKTAIFTIEVGRDGFISGKMQPVFISNCRSNLLGAGSEMYSEIIELLDGISAAYGVRIDENGGITTE